MRPRTVKIAVKVGGFTMPIADIRIQRFAELLKPETELRCKQCNAIPVWHGGYECPSCGSKYNHWSQLKRVVKATGEPITQTRFTDEKTDVMADAYVMALTDFANYVDATLTEYGVTVRDETSAVNLRKLLIAIQRLEKVIVITFKDTYEERVAVLTVSLSGRILLKEIIPINLQDIKETMKVNLNDLTPEEIKEAEQFVKMLPLATESNLKVDDHRTIGISEAERVSPKVQQLEAILVKAKAKP